MSDLTIEVAEIRPAARSWVTWLCLGCSLFSMLIIRHIFRAIAPEPGKAFVLAREACMFASAGLLAWIVRGKRQLTRRAIGIGTSPLWKSLLWGGVIAIACIVPAVLIAKVTGYGHGADSQAFAKLPIWVVFVVVVRAGVVEELFYRGYAINLLQTLGAGRTAAWAIPLVIFSAAHWTGGIANVAIALVLGGVLTAFYLWRRDLVSNMFGHFLVDFVSNVLPAMFG
ncbi:MAG: CPBP family intramembrane glutamic endopeptidase [Acidobacteriaceae bacterium]|jgi:membrane protease YdiL (CAAX protease family)